MGNAPSTNKKQKGWTWEYKNGRAQPRYVQPKKSLKKRPLFKKLPSNNYNWWIFNPDPPRGNS